MGAAGAEPAGPATQGSLLAEADRNLYAARRGGRNRVVTHLPPADRDQAADGPGDARRRYRDANELR